MTIFTLTSARSGTLYLKGLFETNVRNCTCRHEPFFDLGNPTCFGPPIFDAYCGNLDRIRQLLSKKQRYIQRLNTEVYLESSHAFLKAPYLVAHEFFPDMRLVHLVRDPLKVAKSEAYREAWRRRLRAPFHYYTAVDGQRYFAWSLTGNEPIYRHFDLNRCSLFQRYLIQWIELENRAMQFLDRHSLHQRCFTLHTPHDLNDAARLREMFAFFGLDLQHPEVVLEGRRNTSIGHSDQITEADQREADAVLNRLPDDYLEIFRRTPYVHFDWSRKLQRCDIEHDFSTRALK